MKRWWLWSGLGVLLLLIASQQIWASGTWHDPVLGSTLVEATGTEVAGTLTAGALLAGAALLAGLVGARPVRLVAACCLAGGAVLAGLPALLTLRGPGRSLEEIAGQRPGATTGSVRVDDAAATLWPWLALLAAVLVLVGAALCALRWVSSAGTTPPEGSAATDRMATDGPATDLGARSRPERRRDPWDDLTHGQDPTVDD